MGRYCSFLLSCTIHLESGGSGIKQDSVGSKLAYQEVLTAPNMPSYSAITISKDELKVEAQSVNGTTINPFDTFSITKQDPVSTLPKIAVISDPHYYAPELGTTGTAFNNYLAADRKMIAESKAILESTIESIKNSDAESVLVSGDLTKDGELLSRQQFAEHMKQLEDVGKALQPTVLTINRLEATIL